MALNSLDVKMITEEIKLLLEKGKVEKIYQHTDKDLIITIYNRGTYYLYINIDNESTRAHLVKERLSAQKEPKSIIMQMRKYLKNSFISEIKQVNYDRILSIEFTTKTTKFYIIAELIDKGPNIIFTSANHKILGTIRPEKGRRKGTTYELPQRSNMKINEFSPSVEIKEGELYNESIENKYQIRAKKKHVSSIQSIIISPLQKEVKKTKNLIKNLDSDLKKFGSYEEHKKKGDLLQSQFYKIKRGISNIIVDDYETGESITINLDPKLSPKENVERYFKKARKSKTAQSIIPTKIKDAKNKVNDIKNLIEKFKNVEDKETVLNEMAVVKSQTPSIYYKFLEKVHNKILNNNFTVEKKSRKQFSQEKEQFRYFVSTEGKKIYVARNNRENDELTFHKAKGNDEWIHTRDYPGSHVVVSLGKNEDIDGKTLEEACQLALHFSKAKGEKTADLYRTKRKYLTKPKNAPTGMVNISKYKIISVLHNEDLLTRILERRNDTNQ